MLILVLNVTNPRTARASSNIASRWGANPRRGGVPLQTLHPAGVRTLDAGRASTNIAPRWGAKHWRELSTNIAPRWGAKPRRECFLTNITVEKLTLSLLKCPYAWFSYGSSKPPSIQPGWRCAYEHSQNPLRRIDHDNSPF